MRVVCSSRLVLFGCQDFKIQQIVDKPTLFVCLSKTRTDSPTTGKGHGALKPVCLPLERWTIRLPTQGTISLQCLLALGVVLKPHLQVPKVTAKWSKRVFKKVGQPETTLSDCGNYSHGPPTAAPNTPLRWEVIIQPFNTPSKAKFPNYLILAPGSHWPSSF